MRPIVLSLCLAICLATSVSAEDAHGHDHSHDHSPGSATKAKAPAMPADPNLQTIEQRSGYMVGYQVGSQFAKTGFKIDTEQVVRGFKDALRQAKPAMTDEQMRSTMQQLAMEMQRRVATMNAEASAKFLAENGKLKGVTTTKSGLQYKVIKEGTGANPTASDTVTVHYRGTLPSGQEFDSSHKRGKPATFGLQGVIPGWTEGLQLMKPGAKYMFYVPPALGYREMGSPGGQIGPNQALIFEVELLKVEKAPSAPASGAK